MKKLIIIFMAVAMMLSLGTIFASAELPEGIKFTDGKYSVENPDDFTTIGDVRITWDPEASEKLDFTDGTMQDWADAKYNMISITAENMVAWLGSHETVDPNWSITTYFVADAEWLYIGFYVVDSTFTYSPSDWYNGDAFQVCIDFGGKLGYAIKTDPYLLSNPKNIFYSFSCREDNAPLVIQRQESENNKALTEANGDGVKGEAFRTETGWNAEFALSWEMLYEDYVWKAYENDPTIYIGGEDNLPLTIGCCLYYFDRHPDKGTAVPWAAGTTNGIKKDDGTPVVSWTAYDNGVNLYLPYEEGMEFECENLVVIAPDETIPTKDPDDEPTESLTQAPEELTTQAPSNDINNNASTGYDNPGDSQSDLANKSDSTEKDREGCSSVVSMSGVVALITITAAVVLKKRD